METLFNIVHFYMYASLTLVLVLVLISLVQELHRWLSPAYYEKKGDYTSFKDNLGLTVILAFAMLPFVNFFLMYEILITVRCWWVDRQGRIQP